MNLLTTSGTLTTDTTLSNTISGMQGISTMYEMSIANVNNKSLVATITKSVQDSLKTLSVDADVDDETITKIANAAVDRLVARAAS